MSQGSASSGARGPQGFQGFQGFQGASVQVDGWIDPAETWTFASSTTFTVTGDKTALYMKGDKIKFTQSAVVAYFYIIGVSFSNPTTTVTVCAGSDYSIANSAISSNFYSKASTPAGFPQWFNWTPTFTGFSSNPTSLVNRFNLVGTMCTLTMRQVNAGTSNSTGFTMTAPIAAANPSGVGFYLGMCWGTDAGSLVSPGSWMTIGGSNVITIGKAFNNGNWTNSGSKKIDPGFITYEIA